MKRIARAFLIATLILGGVAYIALSSDERMEANVMTGSIRTKMRYAFVNNTEWKVCSTWIADSASRQSIATDNGWQHLSTVSKRLLYRSRGCARAPASYPVMGTAPEDFGLSTTEEIDRFTREFVVANEATRAKMIMVR